MGWSKSEPQLRPLTPRGKEAKGAVGVAAMQTGGGARTTGAFGWPDPQNLAGGRLPIKPSAPNFRGVPATGSERVDRGELPQSGPESTTPVIPGRNSRGWSVTVVSGF